MKLNRALKILIITNSLVLVAAAMLGPIYALFVEKIGGSLMDASLTGGLFALAAGVTTLISGKYADKIKSNELIMVGGYVIVGIGFLLYTFVNSIIFLFAVQILIGFGEAVYWPVFDTLYSKHITKRKAGREWGVWESMSYFTFAFGAIVGGFIVVKLGFNIMFIIMAALCFISAIYVYRLPKSVL